MTPAGVTQMKYLWTMYPDWSLECWETGENTTCLFTRRTPLWDNKEPDDA